jgi:hypothetical protein
MRRTLLLAGIALLAGCGGTAQEPFVAARAAEPQEAELGWREPYPPEGEGLLFVVESLEVTEKGWSARIAVENRTQVAFDAGGAAANLSYGLMLFRTGDLGELEAAASRGGLPPVRDAARIVPAPPARLAPGSTWRATISAEGSLADGSHARVVFGPLTALGDPPAEMEATVVWITDHSHRL